MNAGGESLTEIPLLCEGKYATKPYCFSSTKWNVFSLEELYEYVRQNVWILEEEEFGNPLFIWMMQELEQKELANRLSAIPNFNQRISMFCQMSSYYSKEERTWLLMQFQERERLPIQEQMKRKARQLLRHHYFDLARQTYEWILSAFSAEIGEQECAQILYQMGQASFFLGDFAQAEACFHRSYKKNPQKQSMKQYLFMLKWNGSLAEWKSRENMEGWMTELLHEVEQEYDKLHKQAIQGPSFRKWKNVLALQEQGNRTTYEQGLWLLIAQKKERYRSRYHF